MSDYPEHEKIQALRGDNDIIAAFLEWLDEQGYRIAKWGKPWEKELPCPNEHHEHETHITVEQCPKCMPEITLHYDHEGDDGYRIEEEGYWADPEDEFSEGHEAQEHQRPDASEWYDDDYICKACRDQMCEKCEGKLVVYETRYNTNVLWPAGKSIEGWLAEYFDIDPKKVSEEKEEMYQKLRAMNA